MCYERGDTWADTVQARLLNIDDVQRADAVYQRVCTINFYAKKQIMTIKCALPGGLRWFALNTRKE